MYVCNGWVPAWAPAIFAFLGSIGQVYNIGPDASLTITRVDTGAAITLDGKRRSMTYKQDDTVLTDEPIDDGGVVTLRTLPKTWSGVIEVERAQASFSSEVASNEADFFNGAPQAYYTVTLTEPNGAKTNVFRTQFLGTVFHGYDVGPYEREQTVKVKVNFMASQRVQLGGGPSLV